MRFRASSWRLHPCHREVLENTAAKSSLACRSPWAPQGLQLNANFSPIPNELSSLLMAIPSVPLATSLLAWMSSRRTRPKTVLRASMCPRRCLVLPRWQKGDAEETDQHTPEQARVEDIGSTSWSTSRAIACLLACELWQSAPTSSLLQQGVSGGDTNEQSAEAADVLVDFTRKR